MISAVGETMLTVTERHLCVDIDKAAHCAPEPGAVALCGCVGHRVSGEGGQGGRLGSECGVGLAVDDAVMPLVYERLASRHVPLPQNGMRLRHHHYNIMPSSLTRGHAACIVV